MNKNNLDKLFQEKLKDFREVPDERVWESVEQSLDQRRKSKRVIPIWWKLGGVAAVLAIALLVINPFGTEEPSGTTITNTEKSDAVDDSPATRELPDAFETDQSPGSNDITTVVEDEKPSTNNDSQEKLSGTEESIIAAQDDKRQDRPGKANTGVYKPTVDEIVSAVSETEMTEESNTTPAEERKELVAGVAEEKDSEQGEADRINDRTAVAGLLPKESEEELHNSGNAEIAIQESKDELTEDQSEKKSIFDEIEQQQKEDALVEASDPKWSVGPSVAPVYFSSFGEGSPIHSNFTSNSKSGNVNLSYGVAVSYDISDKLSLRSGLHKVDYGYDTNDISFSSSLVSSTSTQITNISYTSTSRNLVVESSSRTEVNTDIVANDIIAQNPTRNGRMVQEFGYLEIPMELNYSLLDSKFNIDLIGGISSLFLVNNSVTLESSGTSTEMGEANNINDINFSTNVGLGINYELNDKMKVHLEPMFKYQLNTFSEIEGSFQPYSVGVYTGMSFKF